MKGEINFYDITNDIIIYKYLKKLINSKINNKQKKLYLIIFCKIDSKYIQNQIIIMICNI